MQTDKYGFITLESGERFGKLVVIKFDRKTRSGRYWLCQCDCGNITSASSSNLRRGSVKSCGCGRRKPAYNRKYYGEMSSMFWRHVEIAAKRRGHKIEISPEEAWQLFLNQDRKCALSGVELVFKSRWDSNDGTASLDRIDSNGDYTIDNVQWIHKDINLMKHIFNQDTFIDWCRKVSEYATQTVQ